MFRRYSRDNRTYSIDRQFLIGPAFLVTPVLDEGVDWVSGYFPASHWYDYYNGRLVVSQDDNGKTLNLTAPIDHIPLHVRGGYILPTQEPSLTTTSSRMNPFGLIVAPGRYGDAAGDLFYDDGITDVSQGKFFYATFSLRESLLKMHVETNAYDEMGGKFLDKIRIFVRRPASNVKVNFLLNRARFVFEQNIEYREHEIILKNLNLPMNQSFELEWSTETLYTPNSFGPIIDCALDHTSISEAECESKGCFYLESSDVIPKCFVPENKGSIIVLYNISL